MWRAERAALNRETNRNVKFITPRSSVIRRIGLPPEPRRQYQVIPGQDSPSHPRLDPGQRGFVNCSVRRTWVP